MFSLPVWFDVAYWSIIRAGVIILEQCVALIFWSKKNQSISFVSKSLRMAISTYKYGTQNWINWFKLLWSLAKQFYVYCHLPQSMNADSSLDINYEIYQTPTPILVLGLPAISRLRSDDPETCHLVQRCWWTAVAINSVSVYHAT